MGTFIEQLTNIENEFFAEINKSGYTVDFDTYTIAIGKGILEQRIECFDENEDVVVIRQEIEQWPNGELIALGTQYEY